MRRNEFLLLNRTTSYSLSKTPGESALRRAFPRLLCSVTSGPADPAVLTSRAS